MTDEQSAPIRQLRFRLTRDDFAAFEALPRELIGTEKLWLFGPILLCGAAAGFFEDELKAILPWDPTTQWGQLATVLVAVGVGYGLSLLLLTARMRRRIKRADVPESETVVDVFPQVCLAGEEGNQGSYLWSALNIVETGSHVFLCQAGRAPVILPLRAFRDAADMANFAAMARVLGSEDEREDLPIEADDEPRAKERTP